MLIFVLILNQNKQKRNLKKAIASLSSFMQLKHVSLNFTIFVHLKKGKERHAIPASTSVSANVRDFLTYPHCSDK